MIITKKLLNNGKSFYILVPKLIAEKLSYKKGELIRLTVSNDQLIVEKEN
jgi:antitoxin component of MazEF toxin-antitoxin module